MARYFGEVDADVPAAQAFAYMAAFDNAASWDPGVAEASMLTASPIGLGTRFELHVRAFGRTSPWVYEIVDHEPPRRVRFRAEHGPMVSTDTITVSPSSKGSCRVSYDADLRLTGPLRIFDPLLALAFGRIGDRALAGLRRSFEAERVGT